MNTKDIKSAQLIIAAKDEDVIWRANTSCVIDEATHEPVFKIALRSKYTEEITSLPAESTGLVALRAPSASSPSDFATRQKNPALEMAKNVSLVYQMPKHIEYLILYIGYTGEANNEKHFPTTPVALAEEYIDNIKPLVIYDAIGTSEDDPLIPVEWFTRSDRGMPHYHGPVNDAFMHDIVFGGLGRIAGGLALNIFGDPRWDMGNYGDVMYLSEWGQKNTEMILNAASLDKVEFPAGFRGFAFPGFLFEQQKLIKGSCLNGIDIPCLPEEKPYQEINRLWNRLSEENGTVLIPCHLSDPDLIDKIPKIIADYAEEHGIEHMIDAVLAGVPADDTVA